jgi:putative endonuclease
MWLYIAKCCDGSYYTGSTNDIDKRIKLHNAGNGAKCLRGKRPVRLVYAKGYRDYKNALRAEAWLKLKSHREKEKLAISCPSGSK